MEASTLDLYRLLQSGPYDEAGLAQIRRMLAGQRRTLRARHDLQTLHELTALLREWAQAAGGGKISAGALADAADIAELDLHDARAAEELRTQAISFGRAASLSPGTSAAPRSSLAQSPQARASAAPSSGVAAPIAREPEPPSEEVRTRPSVPTEPIQVAGAPALKAVEAIEAPLTGGEPGAAGGDDGSAEPAPFAAPGSGEERSLTAAIVRAELALEEDAAPERVRELAELYVRRGADGDREQAADLYCTLGEVLGNPAGIPMLELALVQVPDHAEAKALLARYTVKPRMPITAPKITMIGAPGLQPPPAAAVSEPPRTAARPELPVAPPPLAQGAADVLALDGVPQVVSAPPPLPSASASAATFTPVVHPESPQPEPMHARRSRKRWLVPSALVLAAAAALGVYLAVQLPQAAKPSEHADLPPESIAVVPSQASSASPSGAVAAPQAQGESSDTAAEPEVAPANPEVEEPAGEPRAAAAEANGAEVAEQAAPSAVEPEEQRPKAAPEPKHVPTLELGTAQVRGGALKAPQLAAALAKAEPKLLACYERALEAKPRMHGRVIYGFQVRPNGRTSKARRAGGGLRDPVLIKCSLHVLSRLRMPKPRRRAAQVKLPVTYSRS